MQHFTRFQLTACSCGPSAAAELLVWRLFWAFYRNSSISCYCVMLCKRTLCWVCPLSSRKRIFLYPALILTGAQNFFGDDLASCRNSSLSSGICESPQQRLSQENSLRLAFRRRCGFCQITLTSCFTFCNKFHISVMGDAADFKSGG